MPYIYSKLAAGVIYNLHEIVDEGRQLPRELARVEIKGGAGVANEKNFQTPRGVVTEVTAEQLAILEKNTVFQKHVKGGFILVENIKADPDKVADNMVGKDKSAPRTPDDYADVEEAKKPKLNIKKK